MYDSKFKHRPEHGQMWHPLYLYLKNQEKDFVGPGNISLGSYFY